jgi:exodeoxyribonuclease-3
MAISIATWNINSVRARIDIVEQFLRDHQPDVLCLQETKVMNDLFPHGLFESLGYRHRVINGQRMHHGVATISRIPLDGGWRYDWQDNGEARHIGVRLPGGVILENVYVPAGGDVPDRAVNPKFGQKLDFVERMTRWSEALRDPAVIVGDFNIAPLECDVWNHKALLDVVSHTPIEVEALNQLQQSHGWVDLGRQFNPAPEKFFTWWSYRNNDWRASDRGRRLDHIWCSPALAPQATAFAAVRDARDWGKPSDHIPQIVTLDL